MMYRKLMKLRSIENIVKSNESVRSLTFNKFYSTNWKCSRNSFEKFQNSKQDTSSNELRSIISSIGQSNDKFIGIHDLDNRLSRCQNVTDLLYTIEPYLNRLAPVHLNLIYDRIIYLCLKSKRKINENNVKEISQFYITLHNSPVFNQLLERTANAQLNIDTLLLILKTFFIIKLDANNNTFQSILNTMNHRLNDMNLEQQSNFLQTLTYLTNRFPQTSLFVSLTNQIRELVKVKILGNQLRKTELMIKYFESYLLYGDIDVVFHIKEQLLSPYVELNYEQSLGLMRCIKSAKNLKSYEFERFKQLDQLIHKCNSNILNSLTLNPTVRMATFCLIRLHNQLDTVNFDLDNFYHPDIPAIITRILMNKRNRLESNLKFYLFFMARNYGRFQIFNEQLFRLIYSFACTPDSQILRDNFHLTLFLHFSRFHLPFVDYKQLAKQTMDSANAKVRQTINHNTLTHFFCDLILYDVEDVRLIHFIDALLERLNDPLSTKLLSLQMFKLLNLTRIYLNESSSMNEKLKIQIKTKFDELFSKISVEEIFPIDHEYLSVNNKIQKNAYLSNGLLIGSLVIYDRSIHDLIPLTEFQFQFNKVDKIVLNENQQVIALVYKSSRNCIFPYKSGYLFHISKILQKYNIKAIEVSFEENKYRKAEEIIELYAQKVLEYCK